MKYTNKFLIILLLLLSFTTQAQTENNPWIVGIGFNAIDFYPTGKAPTPLPDISETLLDGAFETKHWNIFPMLSSITIGRYLGSSFSIELAGSINKIKKIGNISIESLDYFGVDLTVHYSFRNLLNPKSWLDPYLGLGVGYTGISEFNEFTTNGTLGFNFWVSDHLAINLQSTYKEGYEPSTEIEVWHGNDYFQHSIGIKYTFGGKDRDGDGIPDAKDACSYKAGIAEFNGCPDYDGDGIPYNKDRCPDKAGPPENNGCPYEDFDDDGVFDKDDECPEVVGDVTNNGCPQINKEDLELLNTYSKAILFNLDEATIRGSSYDVLDAMVEIIQKFPKTTFHIAGYTHNVGDVSSNENLSRERAAAVRIYLVSHGIPSDQITSEGYGEKYPIASNQTAYGRQQNQRIEVYLGNSRPNSNEATPTND